MGPAPDQPRLRVFELSEFDLQVAFMAASASRKYVQDELGTAYHPASEFALKIALLRGTQVMIHDQQVRARFCQVRGDFRAASIRHQAMWNTAVVGDNTFMHHKVERTGPKDMGPPEMSIAAFLDRDGDDWLIVEDGRTLARYVDEHVRLSLTWTAKVYDEEAGSARITLDEVHARMADAIGDDFAASSTEELFSEAARKQLVPRWPGFLPG